VKSPTEAPPPDYGVRTVCTMCNNSGIVSELRVFWRQPRPELGLPPLACSKRVADRDEADQLVAELREQKMIDIDLISAARKCGCTESRTAKAALAPTPRGRGRRKLRETSVTPDGQPAPRDRKWLSAGNRDWED